MKFDRRPIGVFDSGIGGLTILRELQQALPNEQFIYFGDEAYCPYGPRPEHEIRQLALANAQWLIERNVKAIVVACNTASVTAREQLREAFPNIPFVVVVPAIKPAALQTNSRKIILAATARAINDRFTHSLIRDFASDIEVIPIACPGLVDLVEDGILSGPEPEAVIAEYLLPALAGGADMVVLGCTHFPALRQSVESVAGASVKVIDSGAAVARQLKRILRENRLRSNGRNMPVATSTTFCTSGDPALFAGIASVIVGYQVSAQHASTNVNLENDAVAAPHFQAATV